MNHDRSTAHIRIAAFLLASALLVAFISRFLPAVGGLRVLIYSAGALVAAAAVVNPNWALGAFLFLLMTANHWPYFFGIQHHMAYPPVAVFMFGFFAAGLSLRRIFTDPREGTIPAAVRIPLAAAAALTAVSAGIAFWRWTNFFPWQLARVYDWMTNSSGLPAFGARQNVLLSAAGSLLPLVLFVFIVRRPAGERPLEAAFRAVIAGLGAAVLFGHIQHFAAPGVGNSEFWVYHGQINGTFKDPNAFGGVLSVFLPLMAGLTARGIAEPKDLPERRGWTAASGAVFLLGILAFPMIGARSALLGFAGGMAVFAVGGAVSRVKGRTSMESGSDRRRWRWRLAAAAVVILVAGGALFTRSRLYVRMKDQVDRIAATGDLLQISPERYFLWKHALAMTRDYPLSGVGVGAYIVELPDYYQRDRDPVPAGFEGAQRLDSAENIFLHTAAETGLLGLAVWLAVFAGLGVVICRAVRAGILHGPNRWIFLGATGGLAGFLINAMFHSFSQSFETLFCFWFVAAVVTVLGRTVGTGGGGEAECRVRTVPRVVSVLVIFIFAVSSYLDSRRTLSIEAKSEEFGISQEFGLYRPEGGETGRPFRWTRGEAAWTVEVTGRTLRIPVRISHPDAAERPVRVVISLGKYLLREEVSLGEEVWTEPGRKVLEFPVPAGYSGKCSVRLKVDRTWVPSLFGDSTDPRRLGAAVEFGTIS